MAALDEVDRHIAKCKGKLGTTAAHACADQLAVAIKKLGKPLARSPKARELDAGLHSLKQHASKLVEAAKDKANDRDQHGHLAEIAKLSQEMRSKL